MSLAGVEALRERLTVCSLVLPVLNLPMLLLGRRLGLSLSIDMVRMNDDPVCFALAQGRRKRNKVFHCPGLLNQFHVAGSIPDFPWRVGISYLICRRFYGGAHA
jgi:hypothetical protein